MGHDVPLEAEAERLLRPDEYLSRVYGERGTYHLCLVYDRSRRTRLHAPEICYRGTGWEVEAASRVRCPVSFSGAPSHAREIQLARGSERRLT
ncbi:MAG: exosortase-associated EpsI family protein [Planctomycetes bacterium]|nr:exosortase-associated EpsI family protein [Planctomycetota bacterium]